VFLHLDEQNRHTEWMTQSVLEQVIEDMRYLIGPKIEAEDQAALAPGPSTARKTSGVDVFRGPTYQFGYYLQKAEHHSVLVKHRSFVPVISPSNKDSVPPSSPPSVTPQRARKASSRRVVPKPRKKRARPPSLEVDDDYPDQQQDIDSLLMPPPPPLQYRRSQRTKSKVAGYRELSHSEEETENINDPSSSNRRHLPRDSDQDDEFQPEVKVESDEEDEILHQPRSSDPQPSPFDVDASDEDRDDQKKLKLSTSYAGFSISKYKLCLIVQPYPSLVPKAPAVSLSSDRNASTPSLLTPRQSSLTTFIRQQSSTPAPPGRRATPLFREPSMTPAPEILPHQTAADQVEPTGDYLQPPEDLNDLDSELEDLKQFTQSLSLTWGSREHMGVAGGADGITINVDADEDGWLMGDADERND